MLSFGDVLDRVPEVPEVSDAKIRCHSTLKTGLSFAGDMCARSTRSYDVKGGRLERVAVRMGTVSDDVKPRDSQPEVDEEEKAALRNVGTPSMKKAPSFLRADLIDLANLDAALEKHLNRSTRGAPGPPRPVEEWELDTTKLLLNNVIAQGTYGTVHRGVYDSKDVAG